MNVNAKNMCEANVPRIDKNTQNKFRPVLSMTKPSIGAHMADIRYMIPLIQLAASGEKLYFFSKNTLKITTIINIM